MPALQQINNANPEKNYNIESFVLNRSNGQNSAK